MILEGGAWQSRLGLDSIGLEEDTSICIDRKFVRFKLEEYEIGGRYSCSKDDPVASTKD